MQRFVISGLVLLGLSVSCQAVPSPTVTGVPPSTATAVLVWTQTLTPSATAPPISTTTPTPAVTSTATITPVPRFSWKLDYEHGFGNAGTNHLGEHGTVEIIADPTISGRGFVQRSIVDSSEPAHLIVARLYPDKYFSFHPAPCEAKADVWVDKDLIESAAKGDNSLIVLDVMSNVTGGGGGVDSALQAMLAQSSHSGGKVFLRLFHDPHLIGRIEPGAPEFSADQWHDVRIFVDQNGQAKLFQDGILVAAGKMPSDRQLGTVGGHPGLYAYNWTSTSPRVNGILLVDNWQITCW
jgi:hypothetical protein